MKRLTYLLLSSLFLVTAAGCSKDDATPAGPREYQVEYRISSTTAPLSDYLSYDNESGGTTTLSNVPLPATYRFKRTMKQGDHLSLLASLDGGTAASEITAAILLDGREVKKETGRGADAQAVPVYVIGQ
ncbi:hypothetical protein FY528_20565 [Hymenobacter lutimineralis]|uniref:DUF4843 domain-containing protein n=2 Tax=Hymenobacter TaxID=89966 RepID=A0A5D6URT0_9BACT|nr:MULTISPECIES: hypothetical protein [Hymenobacter]RYU84748.1 hypothetical protein EWM57_00015 [Hymenobacter persicinus]TYZ05827.1 hypothetical protein FY528_20565 [Hymenobacter lutimineralis]